MNPQHRHRGAPPRLWRRSSALALGLAAGLVLAGCGSGSSSGAGSAAAAQPSSDEETILDFYQCLRNNGLDVTDPAPGQMGPPAGIDPGDPPTRAILEDCSRQHFGSTGGRIGNMGQNRADTSALIDFVDCLRGNGIDMADPSADGRLQLPENHDPQSREFQEAARGCSHHLQGGGVLIGEPGGGGTIGRRS